MKSANIVTSIVLVSISLYVVWESLRMGYTSEGVPAPGFIPFWAAVLLGALAALMFLNNAVFDRSDAEGGPGFDRAFWRDTLIVIGGSVVGVSLTYLLGMLAAIGLLTGFLSWAMGTKSFRVNAALAVVTPLMFWLIFTKGLSVNFPAGRLGF